MTRLNSVLSLDISQLKCLVCYKEVGDALEMKKVQCLSGTRGLSKDKRAFKMALGVDAGR